VQSFLLLLFLLRQVGRNSGYWHIITFLTATVWHRIYIVASHRPFSSPPPLLLLLSLLSFLSLLLSCSTSLLILNIYHSQSLPIISHHNTTHYITSHNTTQHKKFLLCFRFVYTYTFSPNQFLDLRYNGSADVIENLKVYIRSLLNIYVLVSYISSSICRMIILLHI
jgi:hypothetical protein